jgi:hypothetical protein
MGRKKKTVLRMEAAAKAAGKPVEEFIKTPEAQKILETPPPPKPEPEPEPQPEPKVELFIQPEAVDGFYDIFGRVVTWAAVRFKDVPQDIAAEAFPFTPADKDILRKPTAKVLNKYAPEWLMKYQDEIALTLMLVTVINAKIRLCNTLAASRAAQESPSAVHVMEVVQ